MKKQQSSKHGTMSGKSGDDLVHVDYDVLEARALSKIDTLNVMYGRSGNVQNIARERPVGIRALHRMQVERGQFQRIMYEMVSRKAKLIEHVIDADTLAEMKKAYFT